MKKLKLIAIQSQKEDILKDLMLLGCVQINEPDIEGESDSAKVAKRGTLIGYRTQRSTLMSALDKLKKYAPYKKGLLDPLPEISLDAVLDESVLDRDLASAQKILDNDVAIRSVTAQENRETATIAAMQPWIDMDWDLAMTGTQYTEIAYGTIPANESIEKVRATVSQYEADINLISEDKSYHFICLVYYKGLGEEVIDALKVHEFVPVVMAGHTGTPREVAARAQKSLEELAVKKKELTDAIAAEAENRKDLQLGIEILQTRIDREEASLKALNTKSTFMLEGWLTAPDEERLAQTLEKYTCAWETEDPDPSKPEEVPVKLKNNSLTRPYNVVTEMYSLPAYNGLDPNPFIMPFFALFFGFMFADMAYGLILLAAGIILRKKANPKGTLGYFTGLLKECGITTFIMGFLTGGFFGDLVHVIGTWFGADIQLVPDFAHFTVMGSELTLPLNLTSGNNPLYVLIIAIILGAIHLLLGTIIGCYLKIKDGQVADAILNDLCWWVMIFGVIVYFLKGTWIVVFIGLGMMVLGQLITGKGLGKITGIVGAVYNGATGYLGDFLSYSRLMALMLAGSVIASVFNQLGSLINANGNGPTVIGTILFIIVFLIGHVLNFLLNVIGCFVHTLRLQFLEFFGKWYRDGGKAFRPLAINTKFFDISKEEKK